jgi:hypothetical protein
MTGPDSTSIEPEVAGKRLHAKFAVALNTRLADDERWVGIAANWDDLPRQDQEAWIETAAALSKEDHSGGGSSSEKLLGEVEGHRVEVEYDSDGGCWATLIHPATGCQSPIDEESGEPIEDEECWITGWFDEHQADLLHGKITLAVTEEWDGDCARLHINDDQFAPAKAAAPTQPQSLSREEAEKLDEIAGFIESQTAVGSAHPYAVALRDLKQRLGDGGLGEAAAGMVICPDCKGFGYGQGRGDDHDCKRCGGTGEIEQPVTSCLSEEGVREKLLGEEVVERATAKRFNDHVEQAGLPDDPRWDELTTEEKAELRKDVREVAECLAASLSASSDTPDDDFGTDGDLPGFHVRKGVCFDSDPEGKVYLVLPGPNQEAWELEIEPTEWASILAFVSNRGEHGSTYREALDFHQASASSDTGAAGALETWRITPECQSRGLDVAWADAVGRLRSVFDAQLARHDEPITLAVSIAREADAGPARLDAIQATDLGEPSPVAPDPVRRAQAERELAEVEEMQGPPPAPGVGPLATSTQLSVSPDPEEDGSTKEPVAPEPETWEKVAFADVRKGDTIRMDLFVNNDNGYEWCRAEVLEVGESTVKVRFSDGEISTRRKVATTSTERLIPQPDPSANPSDSSGGDR